MNKILYIILYYIGTGELALVQGSVCYGIRQLVGLRGYTICPRSSYPFHIVNYYTMCPYQD